VRNWLNGVEIWCSNDIIEMMCLICDGFVFMHDLDLYEIKCLSIKLWLKKGKKKSMEIWW